MPEFFKPIHFPRSFGNIQKEKQSEESADPVKEIEIMRDTISSLERELEECTKAREELTLLNSELEEEKNSLLSKNKDLETTILDLNLSKKTFEKLSETLSHCFSQIEKNLREDVKELAISIARQLYLADKLPKEEIIAKGLERALNSGVSIGGIVRVFLNPKDYNFIEQFISKIGDEQKNVKIELVKRNDINRGDFLIETSNFWIERKLDNILKEIEEEL